MKTPVQDFAYNLPPELIAQCSADPRDSSRLLVLDRSTGAIAHRVFRDIVDMLRAGDVLVFNATKVFKARFALTRPVGGEAFVLRIYEGAVDALLRPGKKFALGDEILLGDCACRVEAKAEDGVVRLTTGLSVQEMLAVCATWGSVPTPPYVSQDSVSDDAYQTVYAKHVGSVAAPTAGFHFTDELLARIRAKGVQCEEVVLHVGIGTFRPVQTEFVEDHVMHAEFVELTNDVAERLRCAKQEGRRIIAVGTTTTRVLEGIVATQGELTAFSGEINIFITPGFTFRVIDCMITNFHLPKSTLLMLVCAFAGKHAVLTAYAEAVRLRYRFFSFGDAMWIG